ncbi:MAG: DegT/DnrJ/EryC1/StrS family aminotransferase, partial [Candidatus Subteraquimicrobiales bacterium]|nr:DegT/DnrJ/EryC1/StrS family aminotransferase [Candidatus Subteraquimicrobiales bacterium]
LDEMRAALGLVQLKSLAEKNAERQRLTSFYRESLKDLVQIEIPFLKAPEGSACHLFPILLRKPEKRADFMLALSRQGIQTSIHYPPAHMFSYYRSLLNPCFHRLPLTEVVCAREVTLPLFAGMSQEQLGLVVRAVQTFFNYD